MGGDVNEQLGGELRGHVNEQLGEDCNEYAGGCPGIASCWDTG